MGRRERAERSHYRTIGAWEMNIGRVEEDTTGWRAFLGIGHIHQEFAIRNPRDQRSRECRFMVRTGDWMQVDNIESLLVQLAHARNALQTIRRGDGVRRFKTETEVDRLTKELRKQGIRLPSWLLS